MSDGSCLYYEVEGVAITWVHVFPWIVSAALWVGSLRPDGKKELILFAYSWYLTFWSTALWALQINFAILRPHELCGHLLPYAFPSIETFLFGSLIGAFVTYAYIKHMTLSWLSWLFIYTFTICPQLLLVITGYNRWYEVVSTFVLGALSSALFVVVFMLYVRPMLPYLETQAPCTWFHLKDTYCTSHEERETLRQVMRNVEECEATIEELKRGKREN